MASPTVPVRLLAGVTAGLAGTFVLRGLLAGSGRWAPETLPQIRRDPAEFMVEQAESALPVARRAQVPPKGKAAAEKGLQLGYGATFGMLYGLAPGKGTRSSRVPFWASPPGPSAISAGFPPPDSCLR